MSHPFGDLLSRYLHRKHGLSQSRLAEGILQDPSVITKMCKGQRLGGSQARERVVAIIDWLRTHAALETAADANALLAAAGMAPLRSDEPGEQALLRHLQPPLLPTHSPTTPKSPTTRRTNLPAALTSFIGRTRELADVARSIATQRLVTLTGAGGVGKTRLATEVGIRFVHGDDARTFPDGIWLVELADLSQATLVVPALVRLFQLPERIGQTPLDLLQAYLADKQVLLILDNCEHLVDACASVVEHLVQQCWRLHVLATSREELRVPGETTYPVLPLTLPDPLEHEPEQVLAAPAVQLFVARIHTGGHPAPYAPQEDAATIADICRQLDGIPLALELAAPLTRSLSLSEIAAQLQDQMALLTATYRTAIPRHQTMHRALVWSYRLLAPAEQRLLARVSVFAGGWTLDAAQAVCVGDPAADLRPSLQHLVATSLVVVEDLDGERRYRLLEPVRQFARAQLTASGEQDVLGRRHATYYASLAEFDDFNSSAAWQARMEREHDNLRAALTWALDAGSLDIAGRLCQSLEWFWFARGYISEGRRWLGAVLTAAERAPLDPTVHAVVGRMAGYFAYHQGDYGPAEHLFQHSLARFRDLGDTNGMANLLINLGMVAEAQSGDAQAEAFFAESLTLRRAFGDTEMVADSRSMVADSLYHVGRLRMLHGDARGAEPLLEEALMVFHDNGTAGAGMVPIVLGMLGYSLLLQEEHIRAAAHVADAIRMLHQQGNTVMLPYPLYGAAGVWAAQREARRGAELVGVADGLTEASALRPAPGEQAIWERIRAALRTQLDDAAWMEAWAAGRAMTLEQAIANALGDDGHAADASR